MTRLAWDSKSKVDSGVGGYRRQRSAAPYHTSRWTRLSKSFRAQHPLCEECKRKGIIRAAEVVDHIIPYPICEDFFDKKNLQSLCEECNHRKGQSDKKLIAKWRETHPGGGRG